MDMAEAKAQFGIEACLWGNMSCAFSLVSDTVEGGRQKYREGDKGGWQGMRPYLHV
jgi:hypothetical protein